MKPIIFSFALMCLLLPSKLSTAQTTQGGTPRPAAPAPADSFLKRAINALNVMLLGWSQFDKEHKERGSGLFMFLEGVKNILIFLYRIIFGKKPHEATPESNNGPLVTSEESRQHLRKAVVKFVKLRPAQWEAPQIAFYKENQHEIFKYLYYLRRRKSRNGYHIRGTKSTAQGFVARPSRLKHIPVPARIL